jgi:hypothetical protein
MLLYCALVWWGFRERYPAKATIWERPTDYVLVQEGAVQCDPRYIDGPPPRGIRIAWALNLPAIVPALLILLPAGMLSRHFASFASDLLTVASIGVFVPFIWYGVGWWIDDRRGRFPPKLFTLPNLWRASSRKGLATRGDSRGNARLVRLALLDLTRTRKKILACEQFPRPVDFPRAVLDREELSDLE